ncbi:MAG: class I SAM-dependent methyltransferase family protein [Candidatus Aenigmatarchaeota archaeon]
MSFFEELREKLEGKMPDTAMKMLPRSYFMVGDVVTLKLSDDVLPYRKEIGKAILEILPYARSVLLIRSIEGEKRGPKTEVIAGSRRTETLHKEHGCLFCLDPAKIMWSKGNKRERQRMMLIAERGENVVDMFAGVGYWAIPMAKYGKVKSVKAMDINPTAIGYLKKNIALNKLANVEVIKGNCLGHADRLANSADRVVMGYLHGTEKFLPAALKMAKGGATIHFHDLSGEEKVPSRIDVLKDIAAKNGCFLDVQDIQFVKGYAPGINHYVYDLVKS